MYGAELLNNISVVARLKPHVVAKCCSKSCVRSPQKSTAKESILQQPESLDAFPRDFAASG